MRKQTNYSGPQAPTGALSAWLQLGCLLVGFLAAGISSRAAIVINEVHYDPDVKTEPAGFVELYNSGASAVDMSGWQLNDGVQYTIPNGTSLGAGLYLVIAQSPATILSKYGASALGPWTGSLSNEGERIALVNPAGVVQDEVTYQCGFPWPTVGDPPGYSIELVNPAFDNHLGGNWRRSVRPNATNTLQTLIPTQSVWRYFKGFTEASSPTTAWRGLAFNDSGWLSGQAPIGYDPTVVMNTALSDMRSNYTTVFFRRTFVVSNLTEVYGLTLTALYDDGFKVWINGHAVLTLNMATNEVAYNGLALATREDNTYVDFHLTLPQTYLVSGTNIIAIQAANVSLTTSTDFFLDAQLVATLGAPPYGPTPGARNSAYADNVPPQIRQVDHQPKQPKSGEPVTITAKITDPEGVTNVSLLYQVVYPGNYVELTDAAYTNDWTAVPMYDNGTFGDQLAADSVYTAVLPGYLQQHRCLVRYRIQAVDGTGLALTVPYEDDPQPNFAYFCYDGVPAWQGAAHPGVTPVVTFDTNVMRRLPVLQLISKQTSVENAMWYDCSSSDDVYRYAGTLIFDGEIYDHIHYRARGGSWRCATGKNMWKLKFNRGHDFELLDNYREKYKAKLTKLDMHSGIQLVNRGHRGEHSMFDSLSYRLFNMVGVECPNTTFLHFRVIDASAEATADQYTGDFWGAYLAVEPVDGRFLDEHNLPDGNLYKMTGANNANDLSNLGPLGPSDKSDLKSFLYYTNTSPLPSDDWYRTNMDLPRYYSYRAMVEAVHQYDIDESGGKNYYYFHNPETGLWSTHTWDTDETWADNFFGNGNEPFKNRVLPRAAFALDYRNRIREIRDLFYNTTETWRLIDEYAKLLRDPGSSPTFLDADRAMWDWNPHMAGYVKAGQGQFYTFTNETANPSYQATNLLVVTHDFEGCIRIMRNYVIDRSILLDGLATDTLIPDQPTATYIGPVGYPLNRLSFRSSAYSGGSSFAAMRWRAGEVTDANAPAYDPKDPGAYEINAQWESGELPTYDSDITVPASALKVGHAYRVRVRMKGSSGRWSHWSAPVQFVVGEPDNATALLDNLRLSELMFDPPGGSTYEYVELHNLSTNLSLDLAGVNFTAGIDFTFPINTVLAAGGYLLVIRDASFADFRSHYGLSTNVQLLGPYSGNLANEGEKLELKTGAGGTDVFSFTYGNGRGWPVGPCGGGHSLVPLDRAIDGQATGALDYPGNWRASSYIGGSPGSAEPAPPAPTVVLNEIAAHTDYSDPAHPQFDSNDWIELYNSAATNVLLSSCYLSDDPASLQKWAIPTVTIPAGGRISYDEVHDFHNPTNTGFGLNKAGEQVVLSWLPGTGPRRVMDAVRFKGQENGWSLGRWPDGAADWFALAPTTRDAANTAPPSHPVISEIMYHPAGVGDAVDQYVELFNPAAAAVSLGPATGCWRLDGGIGFTFPTNNILAAGSLMLIVNFDPADALTLAAFRAYYGITNTGVPILGPYSGKLSNRSDRVALEKPQPPDLPSDPYSWVIVDEVIYGNQAPWPTSADGGGFSLQRLATTQSGNDPANWAAGLPTPAQALVVPDAPASLTAIPQDSQVALSWPPTAGALSYQVKRSFTDDGPYVVISSTIQTHYTDAGLANGLTYYYVVSAINGAAESANSPGASATPQPLHLEPQLFASGHSLTLSWPDWAVSTSLWRATNLVSPIHWELLTNAPQRSNSLFRLSVPTTNRCQFFRLGPAQP